MIETLVKMSGTTHESRVDSKTITKDNERLFNKNEGKISYTMATKERPVVQFNDFMFIKERNSIIIKAGGSPIWNRNETAYPMSWRLLKNQIKIPGKKFSLQTIPTNSTAIDFDVRKNQPNFFAMLEQRLAQAKEADIAKQLYMSRYGIGESEFILKDQNVVADDIMDVVNRIVRGGVKVEEEVVSDAEAEAGGEAPFFVEDEFDGDGILDGAEDNRELANEAASAGAEKAEHERPRYAGGQISREDLVSIGGQVNRQLDKVIALAYEDSKQYFADGPDFRVDASTGELFSATNVPYVTSTHGADADDVDLLDDAGDVGDTRVFKEGEEGRPTVYGVTDAFLKYLAELPDWKGLADGRFEAEAAKIYAQTKA